MESEENREGRLLGWCCCWRKGRWRRRLRAPCGRCVGCNVGVAALDTSDLCTTGTSDTGEPATTATYEPSEDLSAAFALGFSIVDALALIATLGLRLLVRIETCKYAAHEPHYLKPGVT